MGFVDGSPSPPEGGPVDLSDVRFVCTDLERRWPELVEDPDSLQLEGVDPRRIQNNGEFIWIVSTYLRLRALGTGVRIAELPDECCMNVSTEHRLLSTRGAERFFLVVPEADRDWTSWADYRLCQSPALMRPGRRSLIGHWPQPGLIVRDPQRGSNLQRLGYVGPGENLAKVFRTDAFRQQLKSLGVELVLRVDPSCWHDFSDLDAYLAVRDWPRALLRTKPATKLVHAWLTGVVGLMGPEPSYRHWGTDGEDYFEVRTPENVLAVVRRLQCEPGLYDRVRERGLSKSRDHDEEAVTRQWMDVLSGPIRRTFDEWQGAGRWTWRARRMRRRWQRWAMPVRKKLYTLRSQGLRAVARRLGRGGGRSP